MPWGEELFVFALWCLEHWLSWPFGSVWLPQPLKQQAAQQTKFFLGGVWTQEFLPGRTASKYQSSGTETLILEIDPLVYSAHSAFWSHSCCHTFQSLLTCVECTQNVPELHTKLIWIFANKIYFNTSPKFQLRHGNMNDTSPTPNQWTTFHQTHHSWNIYIFWYHPVCARKNIPQVLELLHLQTHILNFLTQPSMSFRTFVSEIVYTVLLSP